MQASSTIAADQVVAVMLKSELPHWQGVMSLKYQAVIWPLGWNFNRYIDVPMHYYEIIGQARALNLIKKGRYRYYLTEAGLLTSSLFPPELDKVFLFWMPTYPIFSDIEQGVRLKTIWDEEIPSFIKSGALDKIYKRYQLDEGYLRSMTQ